MKRMCFILTLLIVFAQFMQGYVLARSPDSEVTFSITQSEAEQGGTVELEIHVSGEKACDSIALYGLRYDKNVLEFVGFTDYEDMEKKCDFPGGFDSAKAAITLALKKSEVLNRYICKLRFKAAEGAEEGRYQVSMLSIVKNGEDELTSEVVSGAVIIGSDDHIHSMEYYPYTAGTCSTEEVFAHWYCAGCRKNFSDEEGSNELTDITGSQDSDVHSGGSELRAGKTPTSDEDGYTGDTYCLGCETILEYGVVLPALGETPADVVFDLIGGEGQRGKTVEVTLCVSSSTEFNYAMLYDLIYDKDVFTFIEFAGYEAIEGKCMINGGFDNEEAAITLPLRKSEALNGYICRIRLGISEDAAEGSYTIGMNSQVKNELAEIGSEVRLGEITVTEAVLCGDVNADGEIDELDAEIMAKYFAGWQGYEELIVNREAADMDLDGEMTRADCMILARKVAGWEIP